MPMRSASPSVARPTLAFCSLTAAASSFRLRQIGSGRMTGEKRIALAVDLGKLDSAAAQHPLQIAGTRAVHGVDDQL